MKENTEVRHCLTVILGQNSRLYTYSFSDSVSLAIPSDEQEVNIQFTTAQLSLLEEIIAQLRLLEQKQLTQHIHKLSEELKAMQALNGRAESYPLQPVPDNNSNSVMENSHSVG